MINYCRKTIIRFQLHEPVFYALLFVFLCNMIHYSSIVLCSCLLKRYFLFFFCKFQTLYLFPLFSLFPECYLIFYLMIALWINVCRYAHRFGIHSIPVWNYSKYESFVFYTQNKHIITYMKLCLLSFSLVSMSYIFMFCQIHICIWHLPFAYVAFLLIDYI